MAAAARRAAVVVLAAAVLLLGYGPEVAESSHAVFPELQNVEPANSVVAGQTLRTGYHFQPPAHWINDPNGPLYYRGLYHLFYQYNPKGAVWGNIVWAHSVSTDLINWLALEPAIEPSIPSDEYGCWSGSATIQADGTPVLLYTGINSPYIQYQVQNVAYPKNKSDPFLREWVKPDYNPVIVPDSMINVTKFRDPTTAWLGPDGLWRTVIGTLLDVSGAGAALVYRSKDFKEWAKVEHPLHSAPTGMWECPDFYPVKAESEEGLDTAEYGEGIKHVLKNSLDLTRYEYYTIGSYDWKTDVYVPDEKVGDKRGLRYDYGNYYASKTFYDPAKKRRILWGWSNESDSTADDVAKGWAGIQAIPRKVWLDPSGLQLRQWPVEELETLRGNKVMIRQKQVKSGEYFEVEGVETAQADVEVTFEISSLEAAEAFNPAWKSLDAQSLCAIRGADVMGGVGPFGLWVLASATLEEKTAVFFRVFKDEDEKRVVLFCTDPTKSSLSPDLYKPTFAGFVDIDLEDTERISLRTLIDHSVVEGFAASGKAVILSRVYPSLAVGKDAHLYVFNNGAENIKVTKLTAWEMKKPALISEA